MLEAQTVENILDIIIQEVGTMFYGNGVRSGWQ